MVDYLIRTASYFDGSRHCDDGPYLFEIRDGQIARIARQQELDGLPGPLDIDVAFLCPGLVEAHAHLFLQGEVLDTDARSAFLKAGRETWLAAARANLTRAMDHGVTLIRDAGDNAGINTQIRDETNVDASLPIRVRSPGLGLRRPKRYSALFAVEVDSDDDIRTRIAEVAATCDDLKVFQTGIIDFAAGAVKGQPQFDRAQFTLIAEAAQRHGLPVFVHCSGTEGLDIITRCAIDSVEHGFFMEDHHLEQMAARQIAWVPTFSPVHFQWEHPAHVGWDAQTVANLRAILDSHLAYVGKAAALGVPLVAGSDAGSQGVVHGAALIDELLFFDQAGVPMTEILTSATARPRARWGLDQARIMPGHPVDIALFGANPFEGADNLKRIAGILVGGVFRPAGQTE